MRSTVITFSTVALLLLGATVATFVGGSAYARTYRSAVAATPSSESQAAYKMRNSEQVVMCLSGTTPVKNWKMNARGLEGNASIIVSDDGRLHSIQALTFSLPVRNLKGEQSAMDDDAYRALKADRYKEITFTLTSAKTKPCGEHQYLIEALGNLSVAGVTRVVTLTMYGKVMDDGAIFFTGSEALRMSDYNVERPSVMFGLIKAADEMRLTYTLIFSK